MENMKPIGFVYLTTNIVNGKIYIGQHTVDGNDWKYIGSGTLFQKAVKKYGKENFKRKILRLCYSLHELKVWEHVYIVKYKSTDRSVGYNIAKGDVNTTELNPAKLPEVREKISETRLRKINNGDIKILRGREHPQYGKKHSKQWRKNHSKKMIGRRHSEQTKMKISESQKGIKNHMFGKHLSEQTKLKLSVAFSGKNNPMYGVRICGENHHFYGCKFVWINNGIVNKRGNINEPIPDGWVKGKIQKKKCGT